MSEPASAGGVPQRKTTIVVLIAVLIVAWATSARPFGVLAAAAHAPLAGQSAAFQLRVAWSLLGIVVGLIGLCGAAVYLMASPPVAGPDERGVARAAPVAMG